MAQHPLPTGTYDPLIVIHVRDVALSLCESSNDALGLCLR
jgi:hypothetical protein